jgi:tetratricopeptide (TPR) repeat protein
VKIQIETSTGDKESVDCFSVGRNVRLVLGSIITALGKPRAGNGVVEVYGNTTLKVTYRDEHTGDKSFDKPREKMIPVVGNAVVQITDGAFAETLRGVVLDKPANLQVSDADFDLSDKADTLKAVVEVLRPKTPEELEAELIANPVPAGEEKAESEKFHSLDRVEVTFTEFKVDRTLPLLPKADENEPERPEPAKPAAEPTGAATKDPAAANTPAATTPGDASPGDALAGPPKEEPVDDGSIHSGVFRTQVELAKSDSPTKDDAVLQALPGDVLQVTYTDERHTGDGPKVVSVQAKVIEGNLGGVRVTRAQISDQELRIQTQLKTAGALTNIGNRYKEFGLKENATGKYEQALKVCDEIMLDARALGGRLLEDTYVQLWQIYYEMDRLENAAAMCERLQREFPESAFVDDALLQMADVVRKQGNMNRAIGLYNRLVNMQTSQLRGEAQFGIAECYEAMAVAASTGTNGAAGAAPLYDRAFQEYKKVFDAFPDSGRVGEAVAKMANYYYQQKDYSRAIDIFETVLADHPDAKFLDVILFNYGRCLYRMERKGEARRQFDQLIAEFPESPLAGDAKNITEALAKAGF